jgi:hypothetical protein
MKLLLRSFIFILSIHNRETAAFILAFYFTPQTRETFIPTEATILPEERQV